MMTNKEILDVVQAAEDGETIQTCSTGGSEWIDSGRPNWNFTYADYRVKPELPHIYAVLFDTGRLAEVVWETREEAELSHSATNGRAVKLIIAPEDQDDS